MNSVFSQCGISRIFGTSFLVPFFSSTEIMEQTAKTLVSTKWQKKGSSADFSNSFLICWSLWNFMRFPSYFAKFRPISHSKKAGSIQEIPKLIQCLELHLEFTDYQQSFLSTSFCSLSSNKIKQQASHQIVSSDNS